MTHSEYLGPKYIQEQLNKIADFSDYLAQNHSSEYKHKNAEICEAAPYGHHKFLEDEDPWSVGFNLPPHREGAMGLIGRPGASGPDGLCPRQEEFIMRNIKTPSIKENEETGDLVLVDVWDPLYFFKLYHSSLTIAYKGGYGPEKEDIKIYHLDENFHKYKETPRTLGHLYFNVLNRIHPGLYSVMKNFYSVFEIEHKTGGVFSPIYNILAHSEDFGNFPDTKNLLSCFIIIEKILIDIEYYYGGMLKPMMDANEQLNLCREFLERYIFRYRYYKEGFSYLRMSVSTHNDISQLVSNIGDTNIKEETISYLKEVAIKIKSFDFVYNAETYKQLKDFYEYLKYLYQKVSDSIPEEKTYKVDSGGLNVFLKLFNSSEILNDEMYAYKNFVEYIPERDLYIENIIEVSTDVLRLNYFKLRDLRRNPHKKYFLFNDKKKNQKILNDISYEFLDCIPSILSLRSSTDDSLFLLREEEFDKIDNWRKEVCNELAHLLQFNPQLRKLKFPDFLNIEFL